MNEKYVKVDDIIEYCTTYSAYLQNKGQGVAQAALRRVKEYAKENALDLQSVKRGKWNTHDVVKVLCSGETLDGFCQCTACGDVFPLHYSDYNYCPNCGARMDGESNGRI